MRKSNLVRAKDTIVSFLSENPQKIYHIGELKKVFSQYREEWALSRSTKFEQFTNFLIEHTELNALVLEFPRRRYSIFYWGPIHILPILQTIDKSAYFSHYTAMSLHELTEQIPKTIYMKIENAVVGQAKKQRVQEMSQEGIDMAFEKPVRVSNNIATISLEEYDANVYILAGEKTQNLGITQISFTDTESIRVTGVERTLIDITVRPMYSGGIEEVLKAYVRAKDIVSVNKLKSVLSKLNLIYPYHQAIGFLLDHSGVYKEHQIALFEKLERKYDFYLTHQMGEMEYSEKWRLFYPKGF